MMKIHQSSPDQYGLIHLHFRQLVTQAETVGESPCLTRMLSHLGLEDLDILLPKDMVETLMKVRITLLYLSRPYDITPIL